MFVFYFQLSIVLFLASYGDTYVHAPLTFAISDKSERLRGKREKGRKTVFRAFEFTRIPTVTAVLQKALSRRANRRIACTRAFRREKVYRENNILLTLRSQNQCTEPMHCLRLLYTIHNAACGISCVFPSLLSSQPHHVHLFNLCTASRGSEGAQCRHYDHFDNALPLGPRRRQCRVQKEGRPIHRRTCSLVLLVALQRGLVSCVLHLAPRPR